jgi:DNA-binding transcriptional ArsR family regulator
MATTKRTISKQEGATRLKGELSTRHLDDATRIGKAMSHPLRARILASLNEGVASPNELAQELGEPLGNVAYHVRTLLDLDCVELVETAQRRGALEHYYRATNRAHLDDAAWKHLPRTARQGVAAEWFTATFRDVSKAIQTGTFTQRDDCHLSYTPLTLDEKAWKKLSKRLTQVLDEAMELQAQSLARLGGSNEGATKARLVLVQYEGAPANGRKKS